jgi:hypothetical protein
MRRRCRRRRSERKTCSVNDGVRMLFDWSNGKWQKSKKEQTPQKMLSKKKNFCGRLRRARRKSARPSEHWSVEIYRKRYQR